MKTPQFYRVAFEPPAWKQIMALPARQQNRIFAATDDLETNPRPSGVKKLKDTGDLYRIRVGNFRVVYQVQDDVLLVLVVKLGDRKDVYRKR